MTKTQEFIFSNQKIYSMNLYLILIFKKDFQNPQANKIFRTDFILSFMKMKKIIKKQLFKLTLIKQLNLFVLMFI